MGSISSVASVLTPLLGGAGVPGAILGVGTQILAQKQASAELRSQQNLALQQLQGKQQQAEAQSAQDAALEKKKIAAEAAAAEQARLKALRRTVARQKALFSAQGLGGGGATGSNEAVLLGLYNSAQDEAQSDGTLYGLRTAALDQSLEQQRQKNLLEAAQLSERQKLTRILQGY